MCLERIIEGLETPESKKSFENLNGIGKSFARLLPGIFSRPLVT